MSGSGKRPLAPKNREPFGPAAPLPTMVDLDCIRAAQRGDLIAMSDLMDALLPWVGRICGSIALDAGPDAAQETLIQVMRDLRNLRDPASLRSWVRRIATREAIRHATRRRREPPIDDPDRLREAGDPASADLPSAGTPFGARHASDHPDLRHDIAVVLGALSADQRAILVLRDLEGLSESEAAKELDVARGTIKSRLHRAREAFRQRWPA